MELDKAWVGKSGRMEPFMKATGPTIWLMVRGDSSKLEETFMKESGSTIRLKEKEFTFIRMEPHTQDSGTTISNTVMATKNGQMELNMRVTMLKE